MKILVFPIFLLFTLHAQSLPVIPMQNNDPDQLAQNLRLKKPLPAADCNALDLWECHSDEPTRITDISVRWVQLDEDPELEQSSSPKPKPRIPMRRTFSINAAPGIL